jgi:mRNA interferase MazF
LKREDIILISFPFTDLTNEKVRPAVVISSDSLNQNPNREDIIIAAISSQTDSTGDRDIFIDPQRHPETNLKKLSVVKCEKIFTVSKSLARRLLGPLPPDLVNALDNILCDVLGLSTTTLE